MKVPYARLSTAFALLVLAGCANETNRCDSTLLSARDKDEETDIRVCLNTNDTLSLQMTNVSDGSQITYTQVPVSDARYLHLEDKKHKLNAILLRGKHPFVILDEVHMGDRPGHWANMDMYPDKDFKAPQKVLHLDPSSVKHNITDALEAKGIKPMPLL